MKILILEQNIKDLDTLNKGILLVTEWCKTIGLEMKFEFKDTSKLFSTIPVYNPSVGLTAAVLPEQILSETPPGYDLTCLVYDWEQVSLPQPKNPSSNGNTMQIPIQWYANFPEVFAQFFLHELCHIRFNIAGKQDITHDQQKYPEWQQKQPQEYYLFLLKGLISKKIILTRIKETKKEILGQLRASDGSFGCDTLELPNRKNKKNISCIPKGIYICKWRFMPSRLKYHYQIQDIPGRGSVFIHEGNYFFDTKGCIILGSLPQDINHDRELDLINSKSILSSFEGIMQGKDFTLQIQ